MKGDECIFFTQEILYILVAMQCLCPGQLFCVVVLLRTYIAGYLLASSFLSCVLRGKRKKTLMNSMSDWFFFFFTVSLFSMVSFLSLFYEFLWWIHFLIIFSFFTFLFFFIFLLLALFCFYSLLNPLYDFFLLLCCYYFFFFF